MFMIGYQVIMISVCINCSMLFTEMTLEALHEWSGYMRLDAAVAQLRNILHNHLILLLLEFTVTNVKWQNYIV